jgi:hypothetical protein
MFLGSFLLPILKSIVLGGLSNIDSSSLFTIGAGATAIAGLLAARKLGLLGKIIGGIGSMLGIRGILNFGLKGIKWLPKLIGRTSLFGLLGTGISWGANKLADVVGGDSLVGKLLKVLGSTAEWALIGAGTLGILGEPGLIIGGIGGGLYGLYKGVKEQFFSDEDTTNTQTPQDIQTSQVTSVDLNTQILNTIATNTSTMVSLLQYISNSLDNLNLTLSSVFNVNQNLSNSLLPTWFGLINPNIGLISPNACMMYPNYSYFNLR